MSPLFQHLLIVSNATDTIDRLFEICEMYDDPSIKVNLVRDLPSAKQLIEQQSISVAIIDLNLASLDDLKYFSQYLSPKPVVALISEDSSIAMRIALRAGADDVFLRAELYDNTLAFVKSMRRQIRRAAQIENASALRDSLQRSLEELRADHHAAQHVQQNLLPEKEQIINGIRYEYTLTPSLLLSGDFVDAIQINDDLSVFYLADVSGHGASSALVTVLLKNLTGRLLRNFKRNSSFDLLSPMATLYRVNQEILMTRMGKHMTMYIGLLDSKASTLTYAVGGHHPMPILSAEGEAHFLEGRGMPVGMFESPVFEERQITLPEKFTLTLFSDGILETINKPSLAEKEQLLLRTLRSGFISSAELTAQLEFGADTHPDDVAIMTVSRA